MAIRLLKVALSALIALLCLMYAVQNLVNLDAAFGAVGYVLGMSDHAVYPASFGPAVTHPTLVGAALTMIVALEFGAGLLAAWGGIDLWRARRAKATVFDAAKTRALLGCGVGLFVWLGLFSVVGGAYFQMWQTQIGAGSLNNAFQYIGMCGLALIFINMPEREL
jgi:predicted small integral membrane protein